MYQLLCPNLVLQSLLDLSIEQLHAQQIRGLILDLDNTIIPWDSPHLPPAFLNYIQHLQQHDFRICLLSNNSTRRVRDVARKLQLPFIARAFKPSRNGFQQAIRLLELPPSSIAVVGDQLYTDVLGGNRCGAFTVWVKPLNTREFIGTKLTRQLEKLTIKLLVAKGLLKSQHS